MIKWTDTYTDYNGIERTEDFWFNLTKGEVAMKQLREDGGYIGMLERISKSKDARALVETFEEFLKSAYGVKSPDGRKFEKNEQILNDFVQTEAYSDLVVQLVSDSQFAAEFITGILPKPDKA